MEIIAKEIKLRPITDAVRAEWLKNDLLRHFGTTDEDAALEKFLARRGNSTYADFKDGRQGALDMMYAYARFH